MKKKVAYWIINRLLADAGARKLLAGAITRSLQDGDCQLAHEISRLARA